MFLGLEVSANKELQEQKEVAAVHDKRRRVVFTLNQAGRIRLVVVKSSQRARHTDDHLRDLCHRNPDRVEPLRSELHRHQEIVTIHDCMDGVVHHNKEDSRWRCRHVRMPAVQKDGDVMVPVEEDQRLLVNNNKERIDKFTETQREKERERDYSW